MTAEQWQRVKELLGEALELPAGRREEWLEAECGGDAELRDEVLSLLAACADEEFLEEPVSQPAFPLSAPRSPEGERIGPWRLMEEIGHGGMGTVYRAIRADDEFCQEAAIKIVSRGLDASLLQKRFRTERQILANLEHPYIARLLDGGTTDAGLSYFVMEFVRGQKLTEYCDSRQLGVAERIELFRKICSAVAYAHQNLVVHRDLKPANILVTADGTPKLLDFGIARILSASEREAGEPTVTIMRMATPAYASPEQIRGVPAGFASDIYSLGVILYELLTGHRPYRLPTQDSAALARVICEREPTRASIVVTLTEKPDAAGGVLLEPDSISRARSVTMDQLKRRLRGDLDVILSTALRKEPHRRYETVEQFSEDLQRHLARLPIHARKDTVSYRAGKFVERHRWGVTAGAIAALALILVSILAVHKAAQLSARLEEDHRLATSFLVEIHDSIARLPGAMPAREALLRQSLRYLNGLADERGGDPHYRRSLALAYEKFAELQVGISAPGLGRSGEALETCRKAQVIREALLAQNPEDRSLQFDLANNYLLSGFIAGRATNAGERRRYDSRALDLLEQLVTAEPHNAAWRSALARAHSSVAYGLLYEDKWEDARAHLRRAEAIYTEIAAENPEDTGARRALAQIHYRLGTSYAQAGEHAQARTELRQALTFQERLRSAEPDNAIYRSDIASTHHFLGMALAGLGLYDEAVRSLDQAIGIRQAALSRDPRDSRTRGFLAGNYAERATALLRWGRTEQALASLRTAVQLQQQVLSGEPGGIPARISMADFETRLGGVYAALARRQPAAWQECESWSRRAADRFSQLDAEGHLLSPTLRREWDEAKTLLREAENRRRTPLPGRDVTASREEPVAVVFK